LKFGSLKLLEPSGPVQACNWIGLPLPLLLKNEVSISYFYILYFIEHVFFKM
jgi:hypothetical protein